MNASLPVRTILPAALLMLIVASGCGSDEPSVTTTPPPQPTATSTSTPSPATLEPVDEASVWLLGEINHIVAEGLTHCIPEGATLTLEDHSITIDEHSAGEPRMAIAIVTLRLSPADGQPDVVETVNWTFTELGSRHDQGSWDLDEPPECPFESN